MPSIGVWSLTGLPESGPPDLYLEQGAGNRPFFVLTFCAGGAMLTASKTNDKMQLTSILLTAIAFILLAKPLTMLIVAVITNPILLVFVVAAVMAIEAMGLRG